MSFLFSLIFNCALRAFYVCQNRGSDEQALGARMRIALAIVGAIRSVVTGVLMRSAFIPAPYIIIGNCVNAAR